MNESCEKGKGIARKNAEIRTGIRALFLGQSRGAGCLGWEKPGWPYVTMVVPGNILTHNFTLVILLRCASVLW
jgi:hypothetical protein